MCILYDTTLRDGEQMPGVVFSFEEKIKLAHEFCEAGIDLIGIMPSVSDVEKKVSKELIYQGLEDKLIAATMMRREHIDLSKELGFKNIILFTSVSDHQLKNKLGISRNENTLNCLNHINYANELGLNVYFAGEDSSRAEKDYLYGFVKEISPLVKSFVYCDTLGVLRVNEAFEEINSLVKLASCKIGLHMHNDFGQAVANSLMGILAGAQIVSGTFNGIGERCGNAALEEVILALSEQYGKKVDFNLSMLGEISSLVEEYSSVILQRNKPVVGNGVYSHESGIHVDGIIKNSKNYEPFPPSLIGRERKFYYGKHSGLAGINYLFGNTLCEQEKKDLLKKIKRDSQNQKRSFTGEEILERYF